MKINFTRNLLPHIVAIILFLSISFAYFSPVLKGKVIKQSDVVHWLGMSKEITDYRDKTGEEALWTNNMFGGMPAYLTSVKYNKNLFKSVHTILNLNHTKPVNYIFLCLFGFYIALLLFRVNPWLSIAGAIAFAFSSYFFALIEAGHMTKIVAIGYLPPIIAGIYYSYNRKILLGAIVAGMFVALQVIVNHLQITYYTALIILVLVMFQFINDIRKKEIKRFFKASAALIVVTIFAVGVNFGSLYLTYDYGKDSTRSKSELTNNITNKTSGLDKDYITAWSYGKAETFTLFIPNVVGGASVGELDEDSETYKFYKDRAGQGKAKQAIKQLPLYWGSQPFTSGPVYVGAIVFFLFVLGMFVLKGHLRWWLFATTILAITLAWGKNFMWLTDLFIDYFPGYNKFRDVTTMLIVVEFTIPLLGIIALHKIISGEVSKEKLKKALFKSLGIVGGFTLIFAVMPGVFFSFEGLNDAYYASLGYPMDEIIADRPSLLQADAFRSLVFILIGAALIYALYLGKIKKSVLYVLFAFLFLADMWTINKRYLNDENFVPKKEMKTPYHASQADKFIMQDKDLYYRVLNATVDPFKDASTSYFHKSIGGYHGAKMKRYQELIDFHIGKNNMKVLDMLNTKYIIIPTEDQGPIPQQNPNALGNAWFVEKYEIVENADEEIAALTDFDPASEAIIDKRFNNELKGFVFKKDSLASIVLTEYKPNYLKYESNAKTEQLAVFSDIYYSKGWDAYVDGKLTPHFRTNYVLRAMRVPAGNHTIEYKFEPKMYYIGENISLVSSLVLILMFLGIIFKEIKNTYFKNPKDIEQ